MVKKEFGIVGVGNMGTALLRGIINSNILAPDKILIHDVNKELIKNRSKEFKVDLAENNKELVVNSKYVLIAVKPQVVGLVLEEIKSVINENNVIISIAAGISISFIEKFFNKQIGVVRVMPNTPALVGAGISALSCNKSVKKSDLDYVKRILNAVGMVIELDEKHIDAVTGLSGSGPAYVFLIIEALSDGGVKMGLPKDISLKLATQTVLGSAKMVLETNLHPATLKDMVTSPGGTTITALHEIEKGKLRATLISAVEAATLKAKSMK